MATYASGSDLAASAAWANVTTAVTTQVNLIRVAQKVFAPLPNPTGQPVSADILAPNKRMYIEGQTKPLMEISIEFELTPNQVANEDTLHEAQSLATMKAAQIALAEDGVLFQGNDYTIPPGVTITNQPSAASGILGVAASLSPVSSKDHAYPASIFGTVADGIQKLVRKGQPGPYALFLATDVMAATYAPLPSSPGALVTTANTIAPLVPWGFYSSAALTDSKGKKWGLLVSTGGDPTTLYLDTDAVPVFTFANAAGHSQFRVYERIQFVARDPDAFVKFEIL